MINHSMAPRRKAREAVLKGLYACEISQEKWTAVINSVIKPNLSKEACSFAERLFLKTVNNLEDIDKVISEHSRNWDINRLTAIDRSLLRMAIAEFLYFDQIPTKVSINEAIEIAKRFSTKKSGNFVNGILDSALRDLTKSGRIQKKGRGLINTSLKS